jgi:hypothetical protein
MRLAEVPDSPMVWAPNSVRWGDRLQTNRGRVTGDTTVHAVSPEIVRIDRIPIPLRAQVLSQIDVTTPVASGAAHVDIVIVVQQGAGSAVITRKHFTLNEAVGPLTTIWPAPIDCGGQYISVTFEITWLDVVDTSPAVVDTLSARGGIMIIPDTAAYFQLLGDSRL